MQTQEWARCLQRLRVHQIAHKLTDNNDKIEQNPCPVPAGSQCEYVRRASQTAKLGPLLAFL